MRRGGLPWLLLLLAALTACDDMTDQPRPHRYGREAGPPTTQPADLVPFGAADGPGAAPPLDRALLVHGQERYQAFCAPCHGATGDGHGMVVQRGFPAPPDFADQRLRRMSSAELFAVIGDGRGAMYSFKARIVPEDRWAIVAYLRVLQASRDVPLAALAPAEREQLP